MDPSFGPKALSPERLAYWYFRLNGFLTIENFLVHPDWGSNQGTDADILATRLLHRRENRSVPMEDHHKIAECQTLVNMIIAEVKTGPCTLNGPWKDRKKENMQKLL